MLKNIKNKINKFSSFYKKYHLAFVISLLASVVFLIYNAYLGIVNKLVFNLSISIYYFLLVVIRSFSFLEYLKCKKKNKEYSKGIYIALSILSSVITVVLIGPVILMLRYERNVNSNEIVAISLAAYTTYKMYRAIFNMISFKKEMNLFIRQNLTLSIVSAFVSILTLQNTMINVFEQGDKASMTMLCVINSNVILVFLFVFIIVSCVFGIKKQKEDEIKEKV